MKHIALIIIFAFVSCTVENTIQDCFVQTNEQKYNCDKHDYIQLAPIEQGVKISVSVTTDRIRIYHNGKYHSAIITNGTICNGRSISSSLWKKDDIVTVGIDNGNFADEIALK